MYIRSLVASWYDTGNGTSLNPFTLPPINSAAGDTEVTVARWSVGDASIALFNVSVNIVTKLFWVVITSEQSDNE